MSAASRLDGRTRVVAGAGSGKTAVIADRFRRLVASGADPAQVLVLTFSDRAANEMRARITAAAGDIDAPAVGTFHSLAMRWLREFGEGVGVGPGFDIQEGVDRWIALRELMWELGQPEFVGEERPDDLVTPLLRLLERLKQELVPLERIEEWRAAAGVRDAERATILGAAVALFREHQRRCRATRHLDFDDLLVETVRLLESDSEVRGRLRARHPHMMIDEYQDTNLAQERMVELLAGRSVFVVGDDDQSIYRFRGAALASMGRFLKVFPDAATLTLGRNRRSSRSIVRAAARLVEHNPGRLPKVLDSAAAVGPRPERLRFADGAAEADWLVSRACALVAEGAVPSEIAVLTRTHAIARPIVERLRAAGLSVRHHSAQGFLGQPEVRDVTAMLRLLADPGDLIALARVATRPPAGADLDGLLAEVRAAGGEPGLRVAARRGDRLGAVARVLLDCASLAGTLGIDELLFEVMERSGYGQAAIAAPGADAGLVTANLGRLAELVAEHCERTPDRSLAGWLRRQALVELSGFDLEVPEPDPSFDSSRALQVMTIHQAKGLEFDCVFVPSLVEGRLPQPHRSETMDLPAAVLEAGVRARADHVAEERRLLYVAMTRARRRLWLTGADSYGGDRRWAPSRFLEEIGELARSETPPSSPAVDASTPATRTSTIAGTPGGRRPAAIPELSFSAIATYRECPRQYEFRYRRRLPVPGTVEGRFGDAVHAVLMRLGAESMAGRPADATRVDELTAEEWGRLVLPDERRRPVLQRLAGDEVRQYVAAGGLAAPPVGVERSFTAPMQGWRLRGVVDRVDAIGDADGGGHRLVDYKTGAPLPASRLRRDLQLALYALGAREGLGLDVRQLQVVYLKTGREVTLEPDPGLLEPALEIGNGVAEAIATGDFAPRPERRRCGLCPFALACADAYR